MPDRTFHGSEPRNPSPNSVMFRNADRRILRLGKSGMLGRELFFIRTFGRLYSHGKRDAFILLVSVQLEKMENVFRIFENYFFLLKNGGR